MIETGKKVVVTTEFRGVFFGTLAAYDRAARTCTLSNARNCVYWPSCNRGFLGLAAEGPLDGARVGPAVDLLDLPGITSVTSVTDEAATRWETGPWT